MLLFRFGFGQYTTRYLFRCRSFNMLFSRYYGAGLAAVWALGCSATPTPVDVMVAKPEHDLVFREALELAHRPHLEKRLSADFDMERTWKNEVLFSG